MNLFKLPIPTTSVILISICYGTMTMCMYGTMDHWIMMYHVSHVIVTCFSFIFNIYYIYIYSTLDVPKYPVSKSAVPVPVPTFPGNIDINIEDENHFLLECLRTPTLDLSFIIFVAILTFLAF